MLPNFLLVLIKTRYTLFTCYYWWWYKNIFAAKTIDIKLSLYYCSLSLPATDYSTSLSMTKIVAWQEVAAKKFMNQDISGDALVQFKCEVSAITWSICFIILLIITTLEISTNCLFYIPAGWNHVEVETSEPCSFHGSSNSAP